MFLIIYAVIILLLIGVFIWSYRFSAKKIGKYTKPWIAGCIGLFICFLIFFGDHVVKYGYFRYLCAYEAKNDIYDREKYYRFTENSRKNKNMEIRDPEKIYEISNKLRINAPLLYVEYDKENNIALVPYLGVGTIGGSKAFNLTNGELIYDKKNYQTNGGWLISELNFTTRGSGFGWCSDGKIGVFKDYDGFY